MGAPIDLTGREFGNLTARRINKKASDDAGRRCWDCECRCGAKTTVRAIHLASGHTRSCGCLSKEHWETVFKKFRWKSGKVQKLFDQTRRNGQWFTPREAVKYLSKVLKVSPDTLSKNWSNPDVGCPWLNGKAICFREMPSALNRVVIHYLQDDLDQICDAVCRRTRIPEYPDLIYIYDAAEQLGLHVRTLRKLASEQKPPVRLVKRNAKGVDLKSRRRTYVPICFFEKLKASKRANEHLAIPADRMTVKEAVQVLKMPRQSVQNHVRTGKLDGVLGEILFGPIERKDGVITPQFVRKATLITRDTVERLRRELNGEPEETKSASNPVEPRMPSTGDVSPAQEPKRERGRPIGSTDPKAAKRNEDLRADMKAKKFPSIAAAAKHYHISRGRASNILNGRE